MKKTIEWGSPRQLQAEIEDRKHQFMERTVGGLFKKKKICKFTKTKDHKFSLFEERIYKWSFNRGKGTKMTEYRCGCGKKELEFVDIDV